MSDEVRGILREGHDERRLQEWSLVLSSASIAHRLERTPHGMALVVGERDAADAERLLAAYEEEERRPRPPPLPEPPDQGSTAAAVLAAVALVAFHVVTGQRDAGSFWFERGAADAARILDGEVWRALTALTLHADMAHVAGNAVFCAVFGTALLRAVGPGVGLWVLLVAGTGGNLLNAALRGSAHSAVGASTAVFGGLGALGGLQLVRRRRNEPSWRAWAPLAAALGLLGWLGTAPQSDVVAHLLGFAIGGALGAAAALLDRPPRRALQVGLQAAALATVAVCWLAALVSR